ncbi:MAG: hypothetical protein R3B99_07495 [Polyangiales bacterium]
MSVTRVVERWKQSGAEPRPSSAWTCLLIAGWPTPLARAAPEKLP